MKIHLIAVGQKMPAWVNTGVDEYLRRMPHDCPVLVHEIPAGKRGKGSDIARITQDEGKRIIEKIPKGAHVVALEVGGRSHSTEKLAKKLEGWRGEGHDVAFLIGGAEGLSDECRKVANEQWSLSDLTLPHPIVRVVLAEALYRAYSVMVGHPYHRA